MSPLWRSHRLRLVFAGVVALGVLLVALVHAPFVRTRALAAIITRLEASGVHLTADRLSYNLFTLQVSLERPALTARGADAPFFAADSARVDLRWLFPLGGPALESIEVAHPRLVLLRNASGWTNLPASSSSGESASPVDWTSIGRVDVNDLEVRYEDSAADVAVNASGIDINLARGISPLAGTIAGSREAVVRVGAHETRLSALGSRLSFDGSTLTIEAAEVAAPEGRLHVDGRIDLVTTGAPADLRWNAVVDLPRASRWIDLPYTDAPGGSVRLTGTVTGAITSPTIRAEAESDRMVWPPLGSLAVRAQASMTPAALVIDSLRAELAGGALSAAGRMPFNDDERSSVRAEWQGIDVAQLMTLVGSPIRVASTASGEFSYRWIGDRRLAGSGRATLSLNGTASQRALPIAGRVALELQNGRWSAIANPRVGDAASIEASASGRLAERLAASTLEGRVRLSIADARALLGALANAGVRGVDAAMADAIRGTVVAQADLAGTIGAPRADGTLDASAVRFRETGPAAATLRFSASPARVALDGLRVAVDANVVTGGAAFVPRTGALSGGLAAHLPNLAALSAAVPEAWRPRGSVDAEVTLGGTLKRPGATVRFAGGALEAAGQRVGDIRGAARVANDLVTIETLEIDQRPGTLSLSGEYDLSSERYSLDLTARALAIDPSMLPTGTQSRSPWMPGPIQLSAQLQGRGTVASPQLAGRINVPQLALGEYRLGAVDARVDADGRVVRVHASVPALPATLDGALTLDAARTFSAELALDQADLTRVARATGPADPTGDIAVSDRRTTPVDIAGAVTLRATAAGRLGAPSDLTADVEFREAHADIAGVNVRLEQPTTLHYAPRRIAVSDLQLRAGASVLSARGTLGDASTSGPLTVAVVGSLADFQPLIRLVPGAADLTAAGTIDFRVQAEGAFDAPSVSASMSLANGAFGTTQLPPVNDVAIEAAYTGNVLSISRAHALWQGAELTATGRMPAGILGDRLPRAFRASLPGAAEPGRLEARVMAATPLVLSPFVDRETLSKLGGRIDVHALVEAPRAEPEAVRASVTFDRADLELAGVPLSQTVPTQLRLENGRVNVDAWNWEGAGNRLVVGGHADIGGETPTLALGVDASLDLRLIGAFSKDVAGAGRAEVDVTATGPASKPVIEGELAVSGAEIVVRDPRLAMTDLSGTARFADGVVRVADTTANANGGTVALEGTINYEGVAVTSASLAIRGRGLALDVPDDLRTEVDTDLTLASDGVTPKLTGRVTIVRGAYREPISLTEQLLTAPSGNLGLDDEAERAPLDDLALDVAVVSAQNVIVDNNYASFEAGSNLRVIGTIGAPAVVGRLTVAEGGEVFLGGRTYEVTRASVDFTNPNRIEPSLDIAMETRVQRYDITLEISGTPGNLDVSLRSPGLSQEDAVSLLVTGQLAEGSTIVQTDVARGQLLMLLSGEFLGFAGRAVGLDSVQVGRGLGAAASNFDLLASEADPQARLTITKDLSRYVELVVSQSLRENDDTVWIANYQPIRQVEIRGTTQGESRQSVEFRHELSFAGPGASVDAPASGARAREQRRVASVVFTGTPGVSDAELRDVVALHEGDRFDFYRWQRDQDRLTAWYRSRGYLEADVRGRRVDVDQPESGAPIRLEYQIDRGPRTTLTVEGVNLPRGVVEQMHDAWAQAVFDGFLLEDLAAIARKAMVSAGHLQATIATRVTTASNADAKEIVVSITPGPSFSDRRIVFAGNDQVPSSDLLAAIDVRDQEDIVWIDPEVLQSTLTRVYRSRGFLAASVAPAPPVFGEDGTATLPVAIDEGRPFTIASVDIQGVARRPEAAVRAELALATAETYRPLAIEPARRRVEAAYLDAGYNDARVATTVDVDREHAQVHLVVAVAEGPQQVVSSIEVNGARTTSRGTVEGALDVEPGTPASMARLYRGQKQLYDTGVFQTADVSVEPAGEAATGEAAAGVEPVKAVVSLREQPLYRFRYGIRLTSELAPVEATREVRPAFVADLLRRNLFGRAVTVGVAGQVQRDRRLARAIFSLPTLFGRPVVTNVFATASRQLFPPANEFDLTLVDRINEYTFEQRFRPAADMAVNYGYTFERKHTFEPNPNPDPFFPATDLTVQIARLTSSYVWDTRDDPSDAHRGWFHSSGLEFGSAALGSNLRFLRYLTQQYYFRTVGRQVVLASAARIGAGRGFGGQRLDEKFHAGGGTSVRGFAEESLGPADIFGPLGGDAVLVLNQEVRFPVYRWVRGMGFLDAGNVFARPSDLRFGDLQVGTGVGLRLTLPFVLLRVDLGLPLTQRETQPRARWYFGIGQAF